MRIASRLIERRLVFASSCGWVPLDVLEWYWLYFRQISATGIFFFSFFYFFFLLGSSRFPAGLLATAMFPELPAERISTPPALPTEVVTRRRQHQGGLDLGTCNSAEARASRRACMHTHEKCPPAQALSSLAPCLRCPCLDALPWHQVSY